MDAYRRFARRHPLRFICICAVLVICQVVIIWHFSGENADISGNRSSSILIGLAGVFAPSANVTKDAIDASETLINCERVVRKCAHMTEYAILTILIWSLLFGIKKLPRRYAYIIPVVFVACLGILDEANQTRIDGRYGSWFDVCVDITASMITVYLAYRLTKRYRRKMDPANTNPPSRT